MNKCKGHAIYRVAWFSFSVHFLASCPILTNFGKISICSLNNDKAVIRDSATEAKTEKFFMAFPETRLSMFKKDKPLRVSKLFAFAPVVILSHY